MNIWPWRRETREASFSDAVVNAVLSAASGNTPVVSTATAALEAAAGLVGRAFATAEVQAASATIRDALSPDLLGLIGRALVRRGEIVLYIDTYTGSLRLVPCASYDVQGDTTAWTYRLTLAAPDGARDYPAVSSDSVIHIRWAADTAQPWRGVSPMDAASLSGRLSASLIDSLADEAGGRHGALLSVPVDGSSASVQLLQDDIRRMKGDLALVQGGDWNAPSTGSARAWDYQRIGAQPPDSMVALAELATKEVLMACGVNPALLGAAEGSASREAYRQFLFSTIAPLGRIAAHELTTKLDMDIRLDWQELRAADISGRARAFQSMVGGGMNLKQAVAVSGLIVDNNSA